MVAVGSRFPGVFESTSYGTPALDDVVLGPLAIRDEALGAECPDVGEWFPAAHRSRTTSPTAGACRKP